uniref:Pco072185 n=1 Tax=Arundo donax TaxID=35708 RepID=A0A0A9D3A9_ARUDO
MARVSTSYIPIMFLFIRYSSSVSVHRQLEVRMLRFLMTRPPRKHWFDSSSSG